MAKIHILDKAVAELIAAGEVVERPASIVKELIENAVDAGADAVTVEIRGGGIQYIRVSDNGCGIDREEIPRAFIRHATSKVRTADDLDGIHTLGFRGEALASVAAMCRVELTTKSGDEQEGTTCRIEGGEMLDSFPAGCPTGTTITVQDVFFNTPARMKFLKKDTSEGNSVAQVVDKCALAHPEIAFRFVRDGQQKLRTTGSGDLLAVIRAVYGKEVADAMLPVDYLYDGRIRVRGFVTSPAGARPSRAYQNFFLNGRYVRLPVASAAVEEAFRQKLMGGKFPACALHLDLDASTVDVNVHPAKTEVRFAEEKPVFHAVFFAVKTAVAALDGPLTPPVAKRSDSNPVTMGLPRQEPVQQRMSAAEFRAVFAGPEEPLPDLTRPLILNASRLDIAVDDPPPTSLNPASTEKTSQNQDFSPKIGLISKDSPTILVETAVAEEPSLPELRLIGELFSTYILLEQGEDLVLVDKHAAHERILYEELKRSLRYGNRQLLLAPVTVTLARDDYDALLRDLSRVRSMGFGVEDFGDGAVLVRETPIELPAQDVTGIISEIAARVRAGNRDLTPEALDRLYYSIACRAAVKGGEKNHPLELADIVEKLRHNPDITHCPHGRPVSRRMSKRELEKLFGRIV